MQELIPLLCRGCWLDASDSTINFASVADAYNADPYLCVSDLADEAPVADAIFPEFA